MDGEESGQAIQLKIGKEWKKLLEKASLIPIVSTLTFKKKIMTHKDIRGK